jgi:hypothetical protein
MDLNIVIDFDHTLINSNKLLENVEKKISEKMPGQDTKEDFYGSYEAHKKNYGVHIPIYHIIYLMRQGMSYNDLCFAYEQYYDMAKNCLFEDTLPFLESAKDFGKLILYSEGSLEHQLKTIVASGIYDRFDDVIVVKDKMPLSLPNMVVIDDRPKNLKKGKTIRVKRGKYWEEKGKFDYEVESLMDIIPILKKLKNKKGKR